MSDKGTGMKRVKVDMNQMATQLLYLMNMIIIKQLNKVKTPKILNVCCINHSVL